MKLLESGFFWTHLFSAQIKNFRDLHQQVSGFIYRLSQVNGLKRVEIHATHEEAHLLRGKYQD